MVVPCFKMMMIGKNKLIKKIGSKRRPTKNAILHNNFGTKDECFHLGEIANTGMENQTTLD